MLIIDSIILSYTMFDDNCGGIKQMTNELLTVKDIAERLQLRQETIRRYIREGHLTAMVLPGGDYRVMEKDLDVLLTQAKSPENE